MYPHGSREGTGRQSGLESWEQTEKNYRAGGARGEVDRGISGELATVKARISSGFTCETSEMLGDGVTTAAPTAEHTGQKCVPVGALVKSAQ
jgi:hypothetical protein